MKECKEHDLAAWVGEVVELCCIAFAVEVCFVVLAFFMLIP